MPAPDPVRHLVDHFHANLAAVKSGLYNETQARLEFINPLFAALGWDMDNRHKLPLDQREVIHEDAIRVGKSLKAPDYSFRVGGQRKFFVEAKQPSVKLDQAAAPAFQLRRYAWSASLPLSILTDFEEFAVYDCRYEPSQFDLPQVALVDYIKYTDYAARWDDIAGRFGYDAVRAGSLDRYAEAVKAKKGALTVDKAFLREIERWRDLLARNLAQRNPGLGHAALNYAVQMTIDRLIFLRMAEDRAIEHYGKLQQAAATPHVYANLVFQFSQADARYNSGLFHFKPEAGREREDSLTLGLTIDDEPLRDIITHLYYPDSPYAFTVMPVEMLGQVYEQFLGKVISLTPDHRAVVEEKPEVRKAGGVYYTPAYIVDYIVRHTLGPLLDGKTPADFTPLATRDEGRKTKQNPISPSSTRPSSLVTPQSLRVLDPACGSGSFLLGAYSYLLDWYRDQYAADGPAKHKTRLRQAAGGGWGLTLAERKRVLLDHIYGVDLDPQAVEVTKLSLLLKVLEGETAETLDPQTRLFHDRALPDLSANIQCGNSLIGPDFLAGRPYDPDEAARVNPFDWRAAFPHVFAGDTPGFDAVIGNPPYVRQELLGELKGYFQQHYSVYHGVADLYVYFIEKSFEILKRTGMYGVIVANKWMQTSYGEPLRRWLKSRRIVEITDFGALPIFKGATTYTCILVLAKDNDADAFFSTEVDTLEFRNLEEYVLKNRHTVRQSALNDKGWSIAGQDEDDLLGKIRMMGVGLDAYVNKNLYYGVKTGYNEAFVIDADTRARLILEDPNSEEIIKPFLVGRDIKRYQRPYSDKYVVFTRRGVNIQAYPAIKRYLQDFKDRLMPKPKGWSGNDWSGRKPGPYEWYEIQDTVDYFEEFEKPKIIWPGISAQVTAFALDEAGYYGNDNTQLIVTTDRYLLGILNSRLTRFILTRTCDKVQGGFYRLKMVYISQLPVRTIDFGNPADKARHDHVVALVETMLDLHRRRAAAATPAEHTRLDRQIAATDAQLDRLVYDLYGLTEAEIKLVEG